MSPTFHIEFIQLITDLQTRYPNSQSNASINMDDQWPHTSGGKQNLQLLNLFYLSNSEFAIKALWEDSPNPPLLSQDVHDNYLCKNN